MLTKTRCALAMFVSAVLAAAVVLPAAPAPAQPDNPPVASYLHDVSQPIPGVTVLGSIVEQHRVVSPDGVELDTWIIRPNIPETLIPRGYAYGVASVRGTGNSGGCFTIGGPTEADDTAAVIEHYGRQPWANGRVGLVGASYDGTTPQDVWVRGTPSLKTIVPVSGISDLYKYNFVNGIPINLQGFSFKHLLLDACRLEPDRPVPGQLSVA